MWNFVELLKVWWLFPIWVINLAQEQPGFGVCLCSTSKEGGWGRCHPGKQPTRVGDNQARDSSRFAASSEFHNDFCVFW